MEQQQSQPAPAQKADCVIVNLELQLVLAGNAAVASNGSDNYHVVDVKARPTAGVVQNHHVVMDVDHLAVDVAAAGDVRTSPKGHAVEVKPKGHVVGIKPKSHAVDIKPKAGTYDSGAADKNRCAACGEPMRWVVIGGRCGHRGVCIKCVVRYRFFQQNKRCYMCGIQCPKVLVAKGDDGACGGRAATPPKLPRFAFRDGRVGNYWYHKHTAAYFEEEKQYQAVRFECEGIMPPFYYPLGIFAFWFGMLIASGACMGIVFASEMKNLTSQLGVCALSIFVALLFATVTWSVPRCRKYEPHELEKWRFAKDNNDQQWIW